MQTNKEPRETYKKKHVVDTDETRMSVRNYLEHQDLRYCLNIANSQQKITSAVEFGCGFGRMTQVLTEFTSDVVGFEREPLLVAEASELIPSVKFIQLDDLSATGVAAEKFDAIITFTFLQHLIDSVVTDVTKEMLRCLKPGGHVLICEETDKNHTMGDPNNPNKICTTGRSIEKYKRLFAPLSLKHSTKRRIEPGYERENTGDYMLFGTA